MYSTIVIHVFGCDHGACEEFEEIQADSRGAAEAQLRRGGWHTSAHDDEHLCPAHKPKRARVSFDT